MARAAAAGIACSLDRAWGEIAYNFGTNASLVQDARMRLAEAVLSLSDDTTTELRP
jgi:hypothetical protein